MKTNNEHGNDLPQCVLAMGCYCAGHARGNPASAACDTSERSERVIAIEQVLRAMHARYGKGDITEIKYTSWSTPACESSSSRYPLGMPLRGMVIARRTSCAVHAKEFDVYSHGAGKLRVHFLGRDRIARFALEVAS